MKDINELFETVVGILELENNCPRLGSAQYTDGYWEMKIRTLNLMYDVFYDPETGELPGIDFEPITDLENIYDHIKPVVSKTA